MYAPTLADRTGGSAPLRRRRHIGRALATALARLEVDGLDGVPASGPVVLAVNHRALLDGPLIFGLVSRPVTFLVKSEAFTRYLGPVLLGAGQVPVSRGRLDPSPVRLALRVLEGGGVIGIFPEGSRGDGTVRSVRPGVGYFAVRTGACVVPVACHGTEALSRRRTLRRPPARIVFGAPLTFRRHPAGRPVNRRTSAQVAEQIRVVLADLVARTAT